MSEVAASPLAATPYDLRHAAVSAWLNGGYRRRRFAEWAGHSVEILKIYAKCLDGRGEVMRQRIQAALGHEPPKPKPVDRAERPAKQPDAESPTD